MARVYMHGNCSFREAEAFLRSEIPECGMSCELKDYTYHALGDLFVSIMVFEKYYMRVSNYASLTVVISGRDGDVGVDLVGAGGRQGIISISSWGAEENFVRAAQSVLEKHGFH